MEKYVLVEKERQSLYAKLAINSKILSSAIEVELIYAKVAEWVKNLTSGDINLTLKDFEKSKGILFLRPKGGKNYIVKASLRIRTNESIIKIFRKENSYSIVHE